MNHNLILRIAGILILGFISFPGSVEARCPDKDPGDIIYIGKGKEFESLNDFFRNGEERSGVHLMVLAENYYEGEINVRGNNLVIEGKGKVNLYCNSPDQNVMWITGSNIVVKNFHMKHKAPGEPINNNCTGRVIAFDGANNVTVENCDLNGCGLSGLHDNAGNSNITIKNNYIHDNSVGAYTDIEGNVWLSEIKDHPVFTFINNRMKNNGPGQSSVVPGEWEDSIPTSFKGLSANYSESLRSHIAYEIEYWKNVGSPMIVTYKGVEWGDYFHLNFVDFEGVEYDFGFGNNHYGKFKLFSDNGEDSAYKDRLFKVYWKWKISTIPCCDGDYEPVRVYQPSIVKLKLVESNLKKIKILKKP